MALGLPTVPFTLVLANQGAELWDPEGQRLATLEPGLPAEASDRAAWAAALRRHLPRRSPVQLVLASDASEVLCQEVPYLSPKEQRSVGDRLLGAVQPAEAMVSAQTADRDPEAEGGHQLWVCAHPEREIRIWLAALEAAGVVPVHATTWERAFLAAREDEPSAALQVVVRQGQGRILVFKGRGLLLARGFALPEDLDLDRMDGGDAELLAEVLGEEATRVLQFVKQKHRGLAFTEVGLVGLSALPESLVERLGRGLRLTVGLLEPSLIQRLLRGCARERSRGGLNLLPRDVLEARKLRALRITVWAAASLLLAGTAAAYLLLSREEGELRKGLAQAQQAREQRRVLKAEAERAGLLRLGLLRLRKAELRQAEATARLERLGLVLFQVPEGITLERVDVSVLPGDELRFHFEVEGVARTRGAFSVGPLARYLGQVSAHPGIQLEPLREVVVSDRIPSTGGTVERAVTRFRLGGVAP